MDSSVEKIEYYSGFTQNEIGYLSNSKPPQSIIG